MLIFLIKLFINFFNRLPESLALKIGRGLGLFWFYIIRFRRKLVIANLKKSFKEEKNEDEIYQIAKDNFIHYGTCLAEFLRLPKESNEKLKAKIKVKNLDNAKKALLKGKGLMVLVGHYGNWDYLSTGQALYNVGAHIITRQATNKTVNLYWQKIREDKGVKFLPDTNSIFSILRLLKKNEVIGIAFDQHVGGHQGIKTNFFGLPCYTMRAPALIAMKTGTPIVIAYNYRDENYCHQIEVSEEIPLDILDDPEETIRTNTQKYNDLIEAFVRERPSQWTWIHRRWKP